jgi:hypothetical protein
MIMHLVSGRQLLGSVNYNKKISNKLLNEKLRMIDKELSLKEPSLKPSFQDIDSMFYDSNGNDNGSIRNNTNEKKYIFEYFTDMLMNPKIEVKGVEKRDSDGVLIDTIGIYLCIHAYKHIYLNVYICI